MWPRRSPPSETARDWAGLWFEIIERDSGEFTGIRFGRAEPGARPAWEFLPHARYDGIGGLAHLLGRERAGALPRLRESARPAWPRLLAAFLRFFTRRPRRAARWKRSDPSAPAPLRCDPRALAPDAVASRCLSAAETEALGARARERAASLNSLLFWALARAAEDELEPGPRLWMMPVNMRGPVTGPETANYASYIELTSPSGSAAEAHQAIRRLLRRREHWGAWLAINLGRVIGREGLRRMYLGDRKRGRSWVGSFSNLGDWPGATGTERYFAPPVSLPCPLGAGVVVCGGRLTLTVQWHPSVSRDPEWAGRFLRRWLDNAANCDTNFATAPERHLH